MKQSGLPPREFIRSVREYCEEHELILPGDSVVAGVSGGPDSVALLLALKEMAKPMKLAIRIAHLNHGLRKSAGADARFVRNLAGDLRLPLAIGREPVGAISRKAGISIEEAGRLARYRFFHEVAGRFHASRVAVGHNRDDQAETFLMRLLRGSSGSGLSGIAPRRRLENPGGGLASGKPVWVIRPLLERSRAEIESFLRLRGVEARRDPTNEDTSFTRNRIRHELLPLLEKKFNPQVRAMLARATQALAEDDAHLTGLAEGLLGKISGKSGRSIRLKLASLARIPLPIRRRVLLLACTGGGAEQKRLTQPHLDALIRLVAAGSGSTHLPGAVASVSGGSLLIAPAAH